MRRKRLPGLPAAAEASAIAVLVAAQAALFGRLVGTNTNYDEGVYLASVDALEHGQRLGADVFAPQPPGFYLLLRSISLAGADSVRGFHWGMVVVAIVTCFAAYLIARAVGGPIAGLTASALLTIAPPFPIFAHEVLADVPPLGLALFAFWLAWEASKRGSPALAASAGGVLALALTMKPNAVLAVPAFLLLLLQRRADRSRTLAGALAGAAVVSAGFLVAYRSVLDRLWESVVVYHQDARDTPDVIDKTEQLVHFLNWRTPFAWLVLAGLIGSVLLLRSRHVRGLWALWSWPAITLLFLVYHHPLHENHLLALPVALAAPVGVALGALVTQGPVKHLAVAALALALAAGYVQQHRRVALEDHPEEPELVRAASVLRAATEPDDLVVSDQPIVAYLARRRVAGPLVDTAQLRFETGSLSNGEVLRILAEEDVKAVVVGRALGRRPGLLRRLDDRYRVFRRVDGIAIYVAR